MFSYLLQYSLDHFISSASLLVTFLTALATLFTVFEMKKQRESEYIPELFIGQASVSLFGFDVNEDHSTFSYVQSTGGNDENKIEKPSRFPFIHLGVSNIGLAAAKHIECSWQYNFERMYQQIASLKGDTFVVTMEKNVVGHYIDFKIKKGNHYNHVYNKRRELDGEIDFIKPGSDVENSKILLPQGYIDLLSYYILIKYQLLLSPIERGFLYDEFKDMSPLLVNLKYRDLGNKVHRKTFRLEFSLFSLDEVRNPFSNSIVGTYQIEAKEIKSIKNSLMSYLSS